MPSNPPAISPRLRRTRRILWALLIGALAALLWALLSQTRPDTTNLKTVPVKLSHSLVTITPDHRMWIDPQGGRPYRDLFYYYLPPDNDGKPVIQLAVANTQVGVASATYHP